MTAITNPAGMARIGNRTYFSMEAFMPDRSADYCLVTNWSCYSSNDIEA